MFGEFLGKVLSAPIKIVNAPLRVADKVMNYALNEDSDKRVMSAPLKGLSDVVEETAEDICDD